MLFNIATATDSYKVTQWKQYAPGTKKIYSYFESRGHPIEWCNEVMVFGHQYFYKEFLAGRVVTEEKVNQAAHRWSAHFGNPHYFNKDGWDHIVRDHGGRLPVLIKALPEGRVVPTKIVLMTIENTCEHCYWVPSWLETLLVELWYTCTVATNSRQLQRIIQNALEISGTIQDLPFKVHDFGFRGVTCPQQAALGGAAHLISFQGTDNFAACNMLMDYYSASMPGFSVAAAEHSTITSWGKENELKAFENMLEQFPEGIVAMPIDSYDTINAVANHFGLSMKEKILSRNGVTVARPDSGELPDMVMKVLNTAAANFGTDTNKKGYKVLPKPLRVLQGDGIDKAMLLEICRTMLLQKWSIDNITFGSGGGLLQKFNRDDLEFAFKCSYAAGDGWERDVYKDPVTMGSKKSKRGRLKLISTPTGIQTVQYDHSDDDLLVESFKDGKILNETTFDEVRGHVT